MTDGDRRRVVVTGVGPICALGVGREQVWSSAVAGRNGAREITRFDASEFRTRFACEVDFDPTDFMDKRLARRSDPMSHMALVGGQLAVADADLPSPGDEASLRTGVVVASGGGGGSLREAQHKISRDRGPDRVNPFTIPHTIANTPAALVAGALGMRGPNFSTTTACAAGTDAVGSALEIIRRDEADVMLAGGVDALVTPLWVAGFDAMTVLSRRAGEDVGSKPFDVDRDGFLIGEGGGVLVLETAEHALERGAKILCEVAGYGASADAHHLTDPDPSGIAQARAIRACMDDAGIEGGDIGYINAHGGSSQPGDPAEIAAIVSSLGAEAASGVHVSATKSMHGHCLGGAGGIEASLTVLALTEGILPPTTGLTTTDASCEGVTHIACEAHTADVDVALSLSFGLGGQNAALCFRRWQPDEA